MAMPHIKKSHKGRLHKALGVKEGKPISLGQLNHALQSKNPHMRQMANFAKNARSWSH